MEESLEVLEQLYKKVLLGAALEHDNQDYVCYLHPEWPDQGGPTASPSACSDTPGARGKCQPPSTPSCPTSGAAVGLKSRAWETTLLQLTVVQVMVTRTLSVETTFHAKERYREIIKILLQSSDFDSKLTRMFQSSDKLLCHMAAKCLALLLYFRLKEKITLSSSWIAFCQKHLSEYSENEEVLYCLHTLTAVVKEILKGTGSQKTEILKQFLTPLDATLEAFYNSLFSQHFKNLQDPSKMVNSLIHFLELLELLMASRLHLESPFPCQRVFFLKAPCVLHVVAWPVQAFVKRKVVVFIKKCLLCKVGEDLCRGSVAASVPPDEHLDGDLLALAEAVLQAVDLGLLKTLSVCGRPSCFAGGDVQPGCECLPGPDHGILRAASLLIIKSLEIKFQNCASAKEMKVDLQRFMSELLAFLKPHLEPSVWAQHPCEWLSRVFIEQDDDMLEAAKASMGIFLKLSREYEAAESPTQEELWHRHTHENGYNPHCIFLFLLKNIGFDSTVLLDFLISSETCFLEYFVRYLKLLLKDWDTFLTICKDFDVMDSNESMSICGFMSSPGQGQSSNQTEFSLLAALGGHGNAHARDSWAAGAAPEPRNQVVVFPETHAAPQASRLSSQQASQSLVDYDSSDDSEVESTDLCVANSKQTSSQQEAMKKTQDTVGTSGDEKELSLELPSRPVFPKESNIPFSVAGDIAPDDTVSEAGISYRTVKCFEELQGAIYRLQKKNLFPYNPTALLKLLKQIEAICNKSMNAL
ncbi:protein Lines homolog 1 [Artibeus jamaicensis]|uniref:protein Lines homolog 1 n=1 Tax=Artibeus jamaicensis TaxID=9417 RepID=UPI00235A7AD1|nr:protein Lines homolog 1 [Artibeus jamaicensis]XP_037001818.2 protein Lines homolog 1 [Artibeus jamaicensis]XP_037001819.2 protein Lines homolog 1 [Artibeus jamaicensis]